MSTARGDGSEMAAGLSKHWFGRENTKSLAVVGSTLVTGAWPDGTSGLDERQLAGFDLDTGTKCGAPGCRPVSPRTSSSQ